MTQTTDNNLPSISNPDSVLKLATDLQKFVQEKKLTTKIQGQEYVNVEGWQYAGSTLGILPIPESIRDISVEGELKYEAKVKLLNIHTGKIIGRGFAVCSNKEQGKKFYAEYAIASMAQTRAVGKAYRLCLGWLMKAAGFQATPAEEMDFVNVADSLRKGIASSKSTEDLTLLLNTYPEFKDLIPVFQQYQDKLARLNPVLATEEQKELIKKLLDDECISEGARVAMLEQLDKITSERADRAIQKMKERIAECENQKTNQ